MGFCKIKNDLFFFSNHHKNDNFHIAEKFQLNMNNLSHRVENKSDLTQFVNAPPFIPSTNSTSNSLETCKVKIHEKLTIPPGETYYAKGKAYLNSKFLNRDLIFIPKTHPKLQLEEAVYSFVAEEISPSANEREPELLNSEQHNIINKIYNLYIPIENKGTENIHINKDQLVGHLETIEDLKPAINVNDKETLQTPPPYPDTINAITPTPEVIEMRKQEFNKATIKIDHLQEDERNKLYNLLKDNFQAFSSSLMALGHTDLITPDIQFTTNYPIKALPFPVPQALKAEVKRQIDEMTQAGIIQKNVATWACPMLLVKKRSNTPKPEYRMTLDLRLLNTVIQHSSYPLPKIQNIIGNIAEFKYFTLLDMPSAFHQVSLPEKYQDKICFTSPFGTYKLKRLPQGLKTSAGQFQAMSDLIIEEINLPGIEAYIDDFIICSNSFEETIHKLKKTLEIFKKHNITLNLTKCIFHVTSVDYLGFRIHNHRIYPITSNIKKIDSFPIPKTKRQVKKFLGLCGFYRNLIPSFATISDPLVALTSPKSSFKWTDAENKAFHNLQKIFFQQPFLQKPDYNKTFFLNTDGSSFAISAVLLQKYGENMLPVAYFSKALRKAETRYPAIQIELMAIVKGITAFRHILYGRHFIIISDSKPLKHYKKSSSPMDIITRWLLTLSEYSFTFEHIPGKQNILADYLSRIPVNNNSTDIISEPNLISSTEILPIVDEDSDTETQHYKEHSNNINIVQQNNSPKENNNQPPPKDALLDISIPTIRYEQGKDEYTSKIIKDIRENETSKYKNYIICPKSNLLLYTSTQDPEKQDVNYRIVIPKKLQAKCLRIQHLTHYGIDKTYQSLCKKYYWKGMYSDVVNFINSCQKCIMNKPQRIPQAPFQNTLIPTRPGQFLSLDFVGPFSNDQYILSVIDHFSKHIKLYPLRSITAMNAVHAIFDYITTFGRPELILSDNGTQFKSHIFQEFNRMLGIKLTHTTTYHPQANAVSERINTSIKATVKSLMDDGYTFTNAIKIHECMYNNTFHSTIKTSPNKVHFGRSLSNITDTFQPQEFQQRLDVHHDYFMLSNNLQALYQQVHENLINFQKLQNNAQHQKSRLRNFKEGDIVYVVHPGKFRKSMEGPFTVVNKCNDVIFEIQFLDDNTAPTQKIHINRLKLAPSRKFHLRKEAENTNTEVIAPNNPDLTMQDKPSQNLITENNNKDERPNIPYFLRPRTRK